MRSLASLIWILRWTPRSQAAAHEVRPPFARRAPCRPAGAGELDSSRQSSAKLPSPHNGLRRRQGRGFLLPRPEWQCGSCPRCLWQPLAFELSDQLAPRFDQLFLGRLANAILVNLDPGRGQVAQQLQGDVLAASAFEIGANDIR